MSINIDGKILNEIMNEKGFKDELKDFLNLVIDEEIEKGDDMNDELVSECVDALMSLEENNIEEALEKLKGKKNIVKFCRKKSFAHKQMQRNIAAAIAIVLIINGVAIKTIPTYAEQVDNFIQIVRNLIFAADRDTDDKNSDVVSIDIDTGLDNSVVLKDESEIVESNIKVTALHSNSEETEVSIEDCKVDKHILINDNGEKRLILIVSYKGVTESIEYQMED